MNFSNRDVLTVLYCSIAILGLILVAFSWFVWNQSKTAAEPISYWLTAPILLIIGLGLILFGLETYLFRDDPDIWR